MRGRLIVFEGIDGCGKTTQIARLHRRLPGALRLREPGGTAIGEKIRTLLADRKHDGMSARTELLLFMAARAQLVEERVAPALARGRTVLLDRYYPSTAAYQGAAGEIGTRFVMDLAERVLKFPRPDRVLLFDVDEREAHRRRDRKADRVEAKGLAYQRRVRRGYLTLARADRRRWRLIDASRPVDEVHQAVLRAL